MPIEISKCKKEYISNTMYKSLHGTAEGTSYRIVYEDIGVGNIQKDVDKIISQLEKSLSVYNPQSIIACVNRNEVVEVDIYFEEVFNLAKTINLITEGAFDISAEPLFRAWGFSSTPRNIPNLSDIASMQNDMGMDKIKIENKKIVKNNPNIIINMNAIAKGYSVDLIAFFLDSLNINNYLVEIGGELRLKGTNEANKLWRIGIDTPKEGKTIQGEDITAILNITDRAIATSGNYRQYYENNGQKIVHTIDPRTGYPSTNDIASVTVLASTATVADAFATAFLVTGVEQSMKWINEVDELEAIFICKIDNGFKTQYSSGAEEYIHLFV